eukprot:TRINITY_DN62939_c0_g1_i1.p1 TRINITY_DN62939_c0_g1~~TRINITY_DN62939_c0_g1_i1.p1  ORF type:complete len:742 (-),score=145.04 TRINITY_DN62939_c0_g1_i1:141-2366(-)
MASAGEGASRRPSSPLLRRSLLLAIVAVGAAASAVVEATAADELSAAGGRRLVGARLLNPDRTPLHTQGRFIVDRLGERVKWACINYFGAESKSTVAGGLEVRPVEEIAARVKEMGFNCIRLPYSAEASMLNEPVEDQFVAANPRLKGKPFMDVLDATVEAFTDLGVMVILDLHVLRKGWCCFPGQDEGLWYVEGFSEEMWIQNLVNMTLHYRSNPMVVAISIKNEVHDYGGTYLSWGDGNPTTDWHMAATKAGNAILQANPDMLVIVMGLLSGMMLNPAKDYPVQLIVPNRVIYETHNYVEYVPPVFIMRLVSSPDVFRTMLYVIMAIVGVGLLALLWEWYNLGTPRPPLGLLLPPVGWWLIGNGLFNSVWPLVIYFVWSRKGGMWCATNLALSWLFMPSTLGLALFGVIVLLVGYYGRRFGFPGENRSLGFGSTAEEEEEQAQFVFAQPQMSASDSSGRNQSSGKARWNDARRRKLNLAVACAAVLLMCLHTLSCIDMWMSYEWTASWFYYWWGFLLEEGRSYTAPVWIGEFGYANEGVYWKHFVRYLSDNDADFAYWALNGKKYGEGYLNDKTANFIFWAGCDTDVRPMNGTNCEAELGTWAGEGRGYIYDVMYFDDRIDACPYKVATKGTCSDYCQRLGRQCIKARQNQGECGIVESMAPTEADGCLEPRETQICVCTRKLWVWDNETFGLLDRDYDTLRTAWRLRDLQALGQSPSAWYPRDIGCLRDYNGHTCIDN